MSDQTNAAPTSTAVPQEFLVSKGVDYYTYTSGPQLSVTITAQQFKGIFGPSNNFNKQNLQITPTLLPPTATGTLGWQAASGGVTLGQGNEQINAVTGQIEGGTMSVMMNTPSSVGSSGAVSYGFYDAGSGIGTPLTNQDQLYVYATDNYSNWMGDLVQQNPQVRDLAFQQFALPGAHDAGTFSLQTVQSILNSPFLKVLLGLLSQVVPSFGSLVPTTALRAITDLAVTQKDNVTTMLDLGIRYFDFRPGTLAPGLSAFNPGVRYHQHTVIPGYPYISFLEDVLEWLFAHPTEIVVVNANTQGFFSPSMNPSPQDLDTDLATAFSNTGLTGKISTGDKSSLNQTVGQLLASNTRLIFLNQISSPPETLKYDSYSDAAYATVVPGPVIGALNGMNAADQTGKDYTVLQMQGTATAVSGVLVPSSFTLSDAYSPLMSTKASFDTVTNPWLLANVSKNLSNSQLVVFLNDFADNCMVSTAITVSKQRMGLL
jgi:hypothetical protein